MTLFHRKSQLFSESRFPSLTRLIGGHSGNPPPISLLVQPFTHLLPSFEFVFVLVTGHAADAVLYQRPPSWLLGPSPPSCCPFQRSSGTCPPPNQLYSCPASLKPTTPFTVSNKTRLKYLSILWLFFHLLCPVLSGRFLFQVCHQSL